jgi:hypothetical protein
MRCSSTSTHCPGTSIHSPGMPISPECLGDRPEYVDASPRVRQGVARGRYTASARRDAARARRCTPHDLEEPDRADTRVRCHDGATGSRAETLAEKPNRGVPAFAPLTRQNRTLTCPDRDARHRILGDDDRDADNFAEQGIEPTQQRATSGQDHSAIDEIGR